MATQRRFANDGIMAVHSACTEEPVSLSETSDETRHARQARRQLKVKRALVFSDRT